LGVLTKKGTIGFDESTWPFESCFSSGNVEYVQNISSDISLIDQCSLVFAGIAGYCGNAIRFDTADWPAIKTWIEDGGRFFLSTEWGDEDPDDSCLQDPSRVADFLVQLGSTIIYDGDSFDCGCEQESGGLMTPGDANIGAGIWDHGMACTAELTGGTTVFLSPSGKRMIVVEALGSGFLFVSGDSNLAGFECDFTNCTILTRMLNYADGDII
jgi:hypothetical protein